MDSLMTAEEPEPRGSNVCSPDNKPSPSVDSSQNSCSSTIPTDRCPHCGGGFTLDHSETRYKPACDVYVCETAKAGDSDSCPGARIKVYSDDVVVRTAFGMDWNGD